MEQFFFNMAIRIWNDNQEEMKGVPTLKTIPLVKLKSLHIKFCLNISKKA